MAPQAGNVFVQDVVDRGPWLFYDRQTTAAAAVTALVYNAFNVPYGGTKTKSDTNLRQANHLPPPQAFAMSSIGFILATTMLFADAAQFLKNYFFQLTIGSKVFGEGPLHLFPGGAGIYGFASTNHATTSLQQCINNGMPNLSAARRFPDYPRIIPANVFFGLDIIAGAATFTLAAAVVSTIVSPAYGGLDVMAVIDGVYDREVQ
jgi:hypothetical protein